MDDQTFRLTIALKCPQCDSLFEAATGATAKAPATGDITICAYCATILRFGEDARSMARVSEAEFDTLPPRVQAALAKEVLEIAQLRGAGIEGFLHRMTCEWCHTQASALGAVNLEAVHQALIADGWTIAIAPDTHVVYLCPDCQQAPGTLLS